MTDRPRLRDTRLGVEFDVPEHWSAEDVLDWLRGKKRVGFQPVCFAIFDHPKDAPEKFVTRTFAIRDGQAIPTNLAWYTDTLEQARAHLPHGAKQIGSREEPPSAVAESWVAFVMGET